LGANLGEKRFINRCLLFRKEPTRGDFAAGARPLRRSSLMPIHLAKKRQRLQIQKDRERHLDFQIFGFGSGS